MQVRESQTKVIYHSQHGLTNGDDEWSLECCQRASYDMLVCTGISFLEMKEDSRRF